MKIGKALHGRFGLLWSIKEILFNSAEAWLEHNAASMGAALAFYTVFSIAPILIIALGIIGFIVEGDVLRAGLLAQAQNLTGTGSASAVETLLSSASYMGRSGFATFVGVVTLLLGASSVFVELQNSLDRIWEIPQRKRTSGIWRILRTRFLSLGLVLGVGFLLMVSLLVSTLMAAFGTWLSTMLGDWRVVLFVIDVVLTLGISGILFALLFKYVPEEHVAWSDVWVGGLATAVLFSIGKFAIGFYLGKSAFSSVYGVAGSFLVLLLWVYYSAQIFLFGAELTRSYSLVLGTHAEPPSSAALTGRAKNAYGAANRS